MKKHVGGARVVVARLGLVAVVLVGCAGIVTDVASLQAQGYQRSRVTHITASGERRENPNYEFWWKESREAGRVAHFCLVPKIPSGGYNWRIVVYVDDRETWAYESGPLSTQTSLRSGIDCTDSRPLPEGRITWRVWFAYWQ